MADLVPFTMESLGWHQHLSPDLLVLAALS